MTLDEEEFQAYIIAAGVEVAAPAYGTTVLSLKAWMRGETECPGEALARWQTAPRLPPGKGELEAHLAAASPVPRGPAGMTGTSLSQRVLADPAVQARLKAELGAAAATGPAPQASLKELLDQQEVDHKNPEPTGQKEADNVPLDIALEPVPTNGEHEPGKILVHDPGPAFVIDEVAGRYSIYPARVKTSVSILMPTIRDIPPAAFFALVVYFRKYELGLEMQTDTLLVRARNMVASRFLASKAQWAWWVDSDMLLPVGNADWYKKKTRAAELSPEALGYDALERLLVHNYPFVGAVYAARTAHAQMIIQPDIDPRTRTDAALAEKIRKGQTRGLIDVVWLGLGCTLIHRRVFEAIGRKITENPAEPEGGVEFFRSEGSKGEDVGFCERATLAGFKPKLDSQLVIGHLGRHCFLPEHTKGLTRQ